MSPVELPTAPVEAPPAERRRFRVEGMDCAACARTVESAVAAVPGVDAAEVSFGTASLLVSGDAPDTAIATAVARAGYRARPERAAHVRAAPFWRGDARALSTAAAVAVLLVAVVASLASAPRIVVEPLYIAAMAIGGWPIVRAAAVALGRRRLDMHVLMTLAAVGAVGIGEYAEGAWVLVLFAVGTGLEAMALDRSRRSVQALMELAPAKARVLLDGAEQPVPVDAVPVGARVLVRPGERVPLDGTVESGHSSLDQSPITGESVPVGKGPGDEVFAGSLNATGSVVIRTSRSADESTLSRVAGLVEQAQASHAPAERFVDRFARGYTPVVFAAAVAVAVVPPLAGGDWPTWLYRALALLIVACPCALVISVPVAVVSAVGGAARRGILIKGGQALEDLARVSVVALDKTGTLTLGLPRLRTVRVLDDALDEAEALALAAAVEAGSEHPLAAAVRRAARDRALTVPAATAFEALPGRGAQARVDGRALWAGGPRLARERTGATHEAVEALAAQGETAIALGEGHRVLAVFGLADRPRPEARALPAALARAGIRHTVMLTGDAEPVARAVAAELGIREWRAELLPEDKLAAVAALGERGTVAMVGDGVNDAPALAAAHAGVAMGAAGSDVALDSADVALMSDRLDRLPEAVTLARRALAVMRANVVASLAIKAVFVALAPLGLVTLVVAVAADMGMSLLVTFNAMRLLRGPSYG